MSTSCIQRALIAAASVALLAPLPGCDGEASLSDTGLLAIIGALYAPLVVDSTEDTAVGDPPASGTLTLRNAIYSARSGQTITFDSSLNGRTIGLTIVGEDHAILKGEVYNPGFAGYRERDYGRTALFTDRDLVIDASALPDGITIRWDGGEADPARVLAVMGDLKLINVTVSAGNAKYEAIADVTQPYTLARGGGIAVWGTAALTRCVLAGNRAEGDPNVARDRGAFGGGIYGNRLVLRDCIISGNSARGYGAAGGGVYSVGGGDGMTGSSSVYRCAVTGNRVTAQHAYGGGVFSEGGGPGSAKTLQLENCTIARNLVVDNPDIANSGQWYFRGGGIYMTNGSLSIIGCTIAENAVTGESHVFGNKPNLGGGGVAATIGNAHVVEHMIAGHSIIAGNTVNGAADDVFTGSLMHFYSYGYNLTGALDFSQILVPVPPWMSLSRKHWPKVGDADGVAVGDVLDLATVQLSGSIVSAGTDDGAWAVLWFAPKGAAADLIPDESYRVTSTMAEYSVLRGHEDDFLGRVLQKLRDDFADPDFGAALETTDSEGEPITFYPQATSWPSLPENAPWIKFWRDLDVELGLEGSTGTVGLGDEFWSLFHTGPLWDNFSIIVSQQPGPLMQILDKDQRGEPRPRGEKGDAGAIEKIP